MDLRIYLAGRLAIECRGEVAFQEPDFRGQQARTAFAYLVLERHRPLSRIELSEVLWPGDMPPAWETALSAVVSRIRSLVGRLPLEHERYGLIGGAGTYQLRLPADAWIDLEAAAEAVDIAETTLKGGEPRNAFAPAAVAGSIARRSFLPGDPGPWATAVREKLRRQQQRALECLARIWLATGEPQLAVEAATEAVGVNSYRESGYQLLMVAYQAAGDRVGAIRVYHRLRQLLADELGTDPAQETQDLYTRLIG